MEIIFSEERMPGESILAHMYEAADFCVQSEGLDTDKVTVSVTFVSSEEIQELNRVYRNTDKVTDVLSFPQFEDLDDVPEDGQICLGDIVICTEQALLQADEFGHSADRELIYLFVHSILHLLGYDHMEEDEKTLMRQKEETVMNKIGLERQVSND